MSTRDFVIGIIEDEIGWYQWSGGSNIMCRCPFHKGGDERRPSFSINVDTGLWTCFTCWMGGSLATLLRELGHNHKDVDDILGPIKTRLSLNMKKAQRVARGVDPFRGAYILPEEVLGIYDYVPLGLLRAGFDEDLLDRLEVGFDRDRRRIIWPLRDLYGNLVGLSGRLRDDDPDQEKFGKYKFYKKELLELYPDYVRPAHNFFWNMHRVFQEFERSDTPLILHVTEGFKAGAWLMQCGYHRTVALMTTNISKEQLLLLQRLDPIIVLCLDGDDPGLVATYFVGRKMIDVGLKVRPIMYPAYATQMDDMVPDDVHAVVEDHYNFSAWRKQLPSEIKRSIRDLKDRKASKRHERYS